MQTTHETHLLEISSSNVRCLVLWRILPLLTISEGDSSHISTFSRADINHDGVLDIDELRTLIAVSPSAARGVTGISDAEHLAQHIMTSSDTNGKAFIKST